MINTKKLFFLLLKWLVQQKIWWKINHLKIHKFVFFYMLFAWLLNIDYDFSYSQPYTNGPVFTQIYGDYTYRYDLLNEHLKQDIKIKNVNEHCAQKSLFLIMTHTCAELSKITHNFPFWNKWQQTSSKDGKPNSFLIDFLDNTDKQMIGFLYTCCQEYRRVKIICIHENYFVTSNNFVGNFKTDEIEILQKLSHKKILVNPVYIERSDSGVLIID
ncbi:hypothetical protein [Ureaplasma zalophigenitalium]|uniref:Uncharacterized protein n=1 Tax=Ureaplasma zalophigenitalium TaxID=907723 RepID=A0ABT3BPN1_9BACT|nr:hypothetical protein [Ureaplasma zalophigenitalium]MCV3754208.1 hypothetical protein [Ureaplasma zalophigenitalium]